MRINDALTPPLRAHRLERPLVRVSRIRIERADEPLGIDVAPRISWQLEADIPDVRIVAVHVRVRHRDALVWEYRGGLPETPEVECPLAALLPDTGYEVDVGVETDHGRAAGTSRFRTGALDGDWGDAIWMRAPKTLDGPAPLFRAEFEVLEGAHGARLYLAVGGVARVVINGDVVGAGERCGPGITAYDHRVQYVVWDVAQHLRPGTNAITVEIGRGFYAVAARNVWSWERSPWTAAPTALLRLVVDHDDETSDVLTSGPGFRVTGGPTRYDDIYGGESHDARADPVGAGSAGFDDGDWPAAEPTGGPTGVLVHRRQPPIRVTDELSLTVVSRQADRVVLDVGRIVAGTLRLTATGPAGHRIEIHYGERLTDDGGPDHADPLGYYDGRFQTDELVLAGRGPETWGARFGWKGFRYVELQGWPLDQDPAAAVVAWVTHTDVDVTGSFASSDPTLDGLHRIAVPTLLNNLHGIPTDTPTYEKNGWTADGMLATEMLLLNFDAHELLAKWVDDIADSRDASGVPRVIAPHGGWDYDWSPAPPWHAAYASVPWDLYLRGGDRRVLADHLDGVIGYLDVEVARSRDGIATTTLGDWMTPEVDPAGGNPPEDARVPATAFLHQTIRVATHMAAVLGRTADAQRLGALGERIAAAFRAAFVDEDAALVRGDDEAGFRQSHHLLALAFGLVPDAIRDRVADRVADDVRARGIHLNTGALSTKYLLPMLTEHGHADLALDLARQRSYPSWGYWLEQGATTLWEHWHESSRSLDHYFLGTYEDWLFGAVAGITQLDIGYRRFRIRPRYLLRMSSASGRVGTPFGTISAAWAVEAGEVTLDLDVPIGAFAEVVLPARRGTLRLDGRTLDGAPGVHSVDETREGVVVELGSGRFRITAILDRADRLRRED